MRTNAVQQMTQEIAAALHSITSSASESGVDGMPRVLAVVRLMTRSNLVGCSTGRSAGFAPAQNLVNQVGGAPEQVRIVWSIAHQPARFGLHLPTVDRRQAAAQGECNDSLAVEILSASGSASSPSRLLSAIAANAGSKLSSV